MKTIVLVNQKGGVGKTTFADEIAWGLERRGREVGFINLDPQGGASHEQKTVEGEKAVTVVDTPGYLNDKLGGCVEGADIAIVPVEPSQRGLRAMKRTIQLITGVNPELEIGLIVNRYSDKRIIDRSFTDFLTADDLPILGCALDPPCLSGAACRPPRRSSAARRSTDRCPRCSRAAARRTRSRGFWTRWRRCCNGED